MTLRLGSISFINSLPVDLGILRGEILLKAQVYSAAPADLNNKISDGDLDVSPVSALHYAEKSSDLVQLADLSINSESTVESVLLISRVPLEDLKSKPIAVTPKGKTTPALLQILCLERLGFRPLTHVREVGGGWPDDYAAIFVIGDEALRWKARALQERYFIWDLAEVWRQWTGLPFVFAVWVARKQYLAEHPADAVKAHGALIASREWGLANMNLVRQEAIRRSGLEESVVSSYFQRLGYEMNEDLKKSLSLFFGLAQTHGLIDRVPNLEESFGPVRKSY